MYKFSFYSTAITLSVAASFPAIAGDFQCRSHLDIFTKTNGVKGDYSAVAQLQDAKLLPSSVGYGASEYLKDEITIVDGKVYLGRNINGTITRRNPSYGGDGVFKMIVGSQDKWAEPLQTKAISSLKELSDLLDQVARTNNCGESAQFSFKIKAHARSIKWSVVNQVPGTDLAQINSDEDVILVGVYSIQDKERLSIPKALNMHLHGYLPQSDLAGHIVELDLIEGGKLYLPAGNN